VYRQPRSGLTRIPYVQACDVTIGGEARAGLVCNLSVLGVFLHLEPPPEVATDLALGFDLPDGGPPLAAEGRVTWRKTEPAAGPQSLPEGCGVRFTRLAPEGVRRISALVTAFRADPRPLLGRVEPQAERARVPFVTGCLVTGAEGSWRGSVCNLSSDGLYVALDPVPSVGEPLIVTFRMPELAEPFTRAATVSWRNPDGPERTRALPTGCGLRFVDLAPEDSARLGSFVDRFAALLEAEGGLDPALPAG